MNWSQAQPFGGSNTWSHKRSAESYTWKELRVYFLTIGITIIEVLKSLLFDLQSYETEAER